jgi:hypothetical protein
MAHARRPRLSLGGVLGALALAAVALVAAHCSQPLFALLVAPFLFVVLIRMGFSVAEGLVLIAIISVLIALSLPSAVPDHSRRNRVRSGGAALNPAPLRTLTDTDE